MRQALFVSLIAALVSGCATLHARETQSTGALLSAAGFAVEAADRGARPADPTAPANEVRPEVRDGKTVYVYRDPRGCGCVYVGGEREYEQYRRLRLQRYEQRRFEQDIEAGYSSS